MINNEYHILEADSVGLCVRGRQILRNVYLCAESSKVTVLSGPNGAGKSSLFKIIFGVQKPSQGNIRLNGKNISPPERPLYIKYLPQFHYIPPYLRLGKVFANYGVSFDGFAGIFPEIGCTPRTRAKELSGGELRLLEIFIILNSPSLFCILDEPFSYVAPVMVERLKDMIRKEARDNNKGIIITDHLHRELTGMADSTYNIADGCIYPADATCSG